MFSHWPVRLTLASLLMGVTGCDTLSDRDKGSDLAYCKLDEMKSPYPSKMELKAEARREAKTTEQWKQYFELLADERRDFVTLCMRARGWEMNWDILVCFPKSDDASAERVSKRAWQDAICYKAAPKA